jgi:carboxypeptidase C (cathepsin A)
MRPVCIVLATTSLCLLPLLVQAAEEKPATASSTPGTASPGAPAPGTPPAAFTPGQQSTRGSVTVGGRKLDYEAVTGTIVVHAKGWDDVPANAEPDAKVGPPEASMFYAAYFLQGEHKGPRPVTFLFNGGPGSPTVWLHIGAFGPKRVVVPDAALPGGAPYTITNNDYSLLDASDLVFIDAPGTGFSRIAGKDREKAFYGVDQDAWAFSEFIRQWLSRHGRWNSPKYLFGESYGTTRAAVLANLLASGPQVQLNGVVMLSQILMFDGSPDGPDANPGVNLPYVLSLPGFAASAWYHHRVPGPVRELQPLLAEVEQFATHDYAQALMEGNALEPARAQAIAQKLHEYTGLPVDYLLRARLRVSGGMFEQQVLGEEGRTAGRLDMRYAGPSLDPLAKEAQHDPMFVIAPAYIAAFNDYARSELKIAPERDFKPLQNIPWDFQHPAGPPGSQTSGTNVINDLASALKSNPGLKVQVNGGYYDLGTPFYQAIYEMGQLPVPNALRDNVEFHFYESGHMVYLHEPSLKALHDNVADFIRRTSTTH